jgi:hypothetical protein
MNPFELLVIGVIGFVVLRVAYWLLVEIPRGHTKEEAICEKCFGKTMSDDVTESMEWCHCPQKEDSSDRHNGEN